MTPGKERRITLILYTAAFLIYSFFLYATLPARDKLVITNADKGKLIWQQYNCTACHQIYGLGGFLGPDLTNTYSKKGPAYIRALVVNGTAVMPNFNLNNSDVEALINYMRAIDASGNADPRTFRIQTDGTIEQ